MVANPDFSTLLANIMSFGIIIIMIAGAIAGYNSRNIQPIELPKFIQDLKNDKIQIGYIDTVKIVDPHEEELKKLRKEIEFLKLKKQLSVLQDDTTIQQNTPATKHPLINDCVAALVALGEKKLSAKSIAESYLLKNPNIKTVEEFIQGVFKK
jgi:hypothetical protein